MWRGPGATFRSAQNYETPHIRHGLRPMTSSPQGEGFSLKPLSPTSNDRTLPPSPASPVSAYRIRRAGHAAAPTHKFDSPYRPSSGPFGATFPQGKANPRQIGSLLQSPTVHPLRATQVWPTSPLHAGRQRSAGRIYEITGSGVSPLPVVFYLLSRLYSLSFGSVTVMVVPLPRVESTWMVPRWIITACLTMDKPRPVPPTSLDRLLSTR